MYCVNRRKCIILCWNICSYISTGSVFDLWLEMNMNYKPNFLEMLSLSFFFILTPFLNSSPPMSPLGGNNTPWLNNLQTDARLMHHPKHKTQDPTGGHH